MCIFCSTFVPDLRKSVFKQNNYINSPCWAVGLLEHVKLSVDMVKTLKNKWIH